MLQKEIDKIMNDKLINNKNKAIVFINNFYDSLHNRITLSEGLLSFLTSMIGFYIVHAAFFLNRSVNEDYLHYTIDSSSSFFVGSRPLLGRFLGGFVRYYNTWTIAFICAVLLSLASLFVIKTFNVKNKITIILISLSIVSFPSLAPSYAYLFLAQNYSISILCAVLAVFMTRKYKYGFLAGSIFLMISLAEYQSYVSLAMALSVMCIYVDIVKSENIKKDFLINISKYLAMGVIGVALYFITMNAYLDWANLTLGDYKGASTMGKINPQELPTLITRSYKSFIQFFDGERFFYLPLIIKIFYIIFALIAFYIVYQSIRTKKFNSKLITSILILLFPLCVAVLDIIAPQTTTETITSYAFVMCIIAPLLISEYSNINILKMIMGILAISIIINNYGTNSRYYLLSEVVYEQTSFFVNRLYSRIEETEGFEYGIPIAVIVDNESAINTTNYNNRTDFPHIKGERGILPKYNGLNQDHYQNSIKIAALFRNTLGADVSYVTKHQIDEVIETEEYEQLTVYPAQGSIKVIDGIMVVNFIDQNRVTEADFEFSSNGNVITITNNYDYTKSQYGWYIYTGGEVIEKFGYSDDNSMSYTVQSDGKYTIQAYTKDIATNEVQVLYAYTFEMIDGQIQSK